MTDEIEKKLLKGCSRTFVEQESSEESFCDYFHGLCKECKAKLSQHRQTKKWIVGNLEFDIVGCHFCAKNKRQLSGEKNEYI